MKKSPITEYRDQRKARPRSSDARELDYSWEYQGGSEIFMVENIM